MMLSTQFAAQAALAQTAAGAQLFCMYGSAFGAVSKGNAQPVMRLTRMIIGKGSAGGRGGEGSGICACAN